MNCCGGNHNHGNHEEGTHAEKKSWGGKHILMMVACCGLPILLLALVPFLGSLNGRIGSFIQRYAFLLCPVMMIGMMLMMSNGHQSHKEHDEHEDHSTRRIEDVR